MPESKDRSTVLARTLAGVARRMRADFERSAEINHAGSKGTVREDLIIANFLRDYLPGTVEVAGSSEILDISGERSPQNDVVIYDRSAPPLYRENQFRIFPAECVYGTLEVKSKLDTRELIDSLDKAERVKNLRKTEYHPNPLPQTRTQYGQVWTYCPTASFVFAYDSIDLDSLAEALVKRYENTPHALRVDGVWVLGKGYLTWFHQSENRILPSSEPGARCEAGCAGCAREPRRPASHGPHPERSFREGVDAAVPTAWIRWKRPLRGAADSLDGRGT